MPKILYLPMPSSLFNVAGYLFSLGVQILEQIFATACLLTMLGPSGALSWGCSKKSISD